MKLSEISIIKSRSGVYQDNAENRRKHRVGQRYGEDKKEDPEEGKEPSNEEWGSITSKMSAEEIQNKLNNMSALDGKVSEEQKASLRKYLEKQLEAKKSEEKSEEPKQEEPRQATEADKEEPKSELKKEEAEESYTRVKFDDVPNSGKVNLKKYLSGKMKRSADEAWGDISKIETKDLQKMERGLVEDFNRQFDDLPKSRRAEKLYAIMKVKGELSKRGKEDQKKTPEVKQEPLSPQELKKAIRTKTKELSNDTLQKLKGLKKRM